MIFFKIICKQFATILIVLTVLKEVDGTRKTKKYWKTDVSADLLISDQLTRQLEIQIIPVRNSDHFSPRDNILTFYHGDQ